MRRIQTILAMLILALVASAIGGCGEARQVAKEEFGPRGALKKYEWFKDAAAQLEKKQADVGVYEVRIKSLEEAYKDTARKDWRRSDAEQHSVWQSEVAGVKASYNQLAAEYNAASAKFNWSFAEAGVAPGGSEKPLPRTVKPYVTQ